MFVGLNTRYNCPECDGTGTKIDTFSRTVAVNRDRDPREAVSAVRMNDGTNSSVLKTMTFKGKNVEEGVVVNFFRSERRIDSVEELAREYDKNGITPDPYAVMAVYENDPEFASKDSSATYWVDDEGKWCFISFGLWAHEPTIRANHITSGWDAGWLFGGISKK